MSNPWRESFDDLRYENGNTYDYFENISEADAYAVDFRKVREAVYQIKQKAKRDNVRLPVAMNQYFSTANLGPAERAAIRAKIMGMREDVELDEEQMTSSDKAKEKRLKSKYDKSGMKKSMIDQYGEKKGKQVYFAKIRKMAMEGLESFVEEKYGEKEEKKYKKSGKKSKDYDGDGEVEDEAHEYAGVKDRAIKKAMRKESSDWRADLGFFTEKRYLESPRVETMPPEKQNDSEQAPKERAANKRLKPKSSEVKENFQNIAESLGGQLVEWEEINEYTISPSSLRGLAKIFSKRKVFTSAALRDASRARGVIPKPKPKSIPTSSPDEAIEKAKNVIFPTAGKLGTGRKPTTITPPNVVSAKQKVEIPKDQFVAPEIPKPVRTPKPTPSKPTKPTKPSVEPQRQPEVPTPTKPQTKPAKSLPAVIDLDTGIIQKVIPQGTSVKTPKPTGKPKQPKSQTQTQPQRVTNLPPTGIGINISTPTTGDGGKNDWELPKLGMPRVGYGQGRTWVARSL